MFSYSTTRSINGTKNDITSQFSSYIIENPFHNRKKIASLAKDASGVYIFTTKDGSIYVGSSVSLYNRVISYFMPSILQNANRRVLHYFKTHGFTTTTLTLHIISSSSAMTSLELEQYFLDTLKPNLNVDKFANSTGFHEPMSDY